jgi:hypothetical protein
MNVDQIARALRAGVCSDEHRIAAVELVIEHRHWLADPTFVGNCLTWSDSCDNAWVDFDRAVQLLADHELCGSSIETLILRIAASLNGTVAPLRLSWLTLLDNRSARLVLDAVARACGPL